MKNIETINKRKEQLINSLLYDGDEGYNNFIPGRHLSSYELIPVILALEWVERDEDENPEM